MAKRPRKTQGVDQVAAIEQALGGASSKRVEAALPLLRHFSPSDHVAWVEDNCYRDLKAKGWKPLRYARWQKDLIRDLFEIDEPAGTLHFRTIMPCLPRRCGKTEIGALYDLHRASEYSDQTIIIQGNSADQGEDTVFKAIVDTILNSPKLARRVASLYGVKQNDGGDIEIQAGLIFFNRIGSIIKVQPAAERTTLGQKIHVYHNTELCRASDDKVYQAGASSTGDAWCGVSIVDSNMGDATNPVAKYVELAQQAKDERQLAAAEGRLINPEIGDPSIGAVYIYFEDLADVLKRGCGMGLEAGIDPVHPWLDVLWIRGRYRQMTRSEFLRNHCNKPSGSGDELWSAEQIDPLFRPGLPAIMSQPGDLAYITKIIGGNGRWKIGVGLDRASAFSKDPDRTVLTCVGETTVKSMIGEVPVYDERGQQVATEKCDGSVYVWLGAWEYMRRIRDPLQEKLLQIDRLWGIGCLLLEAYDASDLGEWCADQRFARQTTVVHMTPQAKHQLVQFSHSLVITRRFFISPFYHVLRAEFSHYAEDASGGGIPSYAGKRQTKELDVRYPSDGRVMKKVTTWIKDDYLESGFWAVDAARDALPRSISGGGRVVSKPFGL